MGKKYIFKSTASDAFADDRWPRRIVVECDVVQSIENNTSLVNWVVKVDGTDSNAYAYSMSMDVRLDEYTGGYYTHNTFYLFNHNEGSSGSLRISSQTVLATGSFSVSHNIDGSSPYKYRLDISGFISDTPGGINYVMEDSSNYILLLDVIPRASTITATTVELGRNPTITINSPSTTFTHTLRYNFYGLTGTIATGLKGGSYNGWSTPTSFLEKITGKYGEGTIYCDTYNSSGSLNGTTSTTFRVNVPSLYGPTIDASIENIDPTTLALTGNDPDKIVQYYNTIGYNIGAFTTTGATIKSVNIACGNKSASTMTGTLTNVESNVFTVSVTDSRDFTTVETIYKDLVPYIKLTAKLQLVSIDTDGFGSIAISGNMFRGSFGIVENNPVISYRWKEEGGTWSNWTSVVYNIYNDSYYAEVEFYGLDYRKTYLYEAKATDRLMTVTTEQLVVKCMPVFDWSGDDFQFNVPVTVTGDLVVTGNVTSANNPVAMDDFIVEQGTVTTGSGNSQANWVYRKWNSGIAECWCRKHISTAVNTAWGNLYVSGSLSYTNITWGVDFIEIPVANITIAPNATGAFLIAGGSTSLTATNTGGYEIARGSALSTAGSFYINYYAIGKWK